MKTNFKNLLAFLLLLSFAVTSHVGAMTGKVLDAQNKPVAGANVLMRFKSIDSNKWQYLEATCDDHGAFAGTFSGKIDLSSETSTPIIYAIASGKAYSIARSRKKNNILHLDAAETVSGRILDQNDKPVIHAKVLLHSVGGKNRPFFVSLPGEKPWATRFQTFTDKNGFWKLKVVPKEKRLILN